MAHNSCAAAEQTVWVRPPRIGIPPPEGRWGSHWSFPDVAPRKEVMDMTEPSHKKTPAKWAVVSACAQVTRVVLDLVRLLMDR